MEKHGPMYIKRKNEKMKLKTTRQEGVPVYGNRSVGYFGIDTLMAQEYFNTTRTRITGPARPDPRIRYFCPKEQIDKRRELIDAGLRFNRSMDEIESEWRKCLAEATLAATQSIMGHIDIDTIGYIPHDPESIKLVKLAYAAGRRRLESEIAPRLVRNDEWSTLACFEFDFGSNSGELIYVRRQRIHSKETETRKAYKIGRSRQFNLRNKSHRTENTDTEIVTTISASSNITESAIHDLFREHRFDLEWFLLSDDDINILKSRSLLSSALHQKQLKNNNTMTTPKPTPPPTQPMPGVFSVADLVGRIEQDIRRGKK